MEVPGIDESKEAESHMTSAAAFVEGGTQEACDDACSICLEAFCESDPSTVTNCKHEFHLQCILEWCQRSSNCPMCWQSISLKDDSSQELLEAVERERSFRFSPWQHSTIFHHPTLGDFELQHLPVGANDAELEERIIQHLAAAAAMGSARHIARRESPRSRSSFFSDQSTVSNQDRAGPSDILSISESLKSRFNAMSMRYKESLSKSTKGWREKLFSRNTSMADLGSEVQREVNAGISSVSRIMEHLETRDNSRGDGASASRTQAGPSITEQNNQNNVEICHETLSNDRNTAAIAASSSPI